MDRSADVLEGLRDLRLPELSEASVLADAAAAFAVGLALALLVALAVRLFARRPPGRRERALAELAAARALAPDERLLAQARLLRRVAEEDGGRRRGLAADCARLAESLGLGEGLYRRDAGVDPDAVDRELDRLLRRVRG